MDDAAFLETVRQDASLDTTDEARAVTNATLRTLGERVTDGEAAALAESLPAEIGDPLTAAPGEAEPFPLETFTERVSDRADIDESEVVPTARAVAGAVSEVAASELDSARDQLPTAFDVIFEPSGPNTEAEFLDAVRDRAALDSGDAARDATIATLTTLGERLSAGEATDLALYLPEAFETAIVPSDDEQPADYSVEEFVRRVSQRESVPKEDARTHVRAVGSVLAETASEREIDAAKKQLPDPFGACFEPPDAGTGDA